VSILKGSFLLSRNKGRDKDEGFFAGKAILTLEEGHTKEAQNLLDVSFSVSGKEGKRRT